MVNLKLALRTLVKAPFVTIVAIISLALGIGANAAIFSLFNQIVGAIGLAAALWIGHFAESQLYQMKGRVLLGARGSWLGEAPAARARHAAAERARLGVGPQAH